MMRLDAMFVTEKFVYLHLPKTGGTFVATTLAAIHTRRGDRVDTIWIDPSKPTELPRVSKGCAIRIMSTSRNQHGARKDIPVIYADRPIVATIRHPFERYVSQYEFAWWRRQPDLFGPVDAIRQRYPHFPDLSFEDYLRLANSALLPYRAEGSSDDVPGMHTQQFVEYFFRDPAAAFPRLADPAFTSTVRRRELADVRLLNQARLNDDLADWLAEMNYAPDDVAGVRAADRVWPPEGGRDPAARWEPYYSPDLLAFVRHKERLLLEWFPEFRV